MKANWKKILMGGILLSASAVLLTACGGAEKTKAENESGSANKAAGDVKLWVDTEYMGVFKKVVADFEKENPDIKVNLTAGNSADAKKDIAKDPKAAADVFMMPHDQIGQMAEAGLIYPNTKYEKEVKENNIDSAVAGVTWKDKVYAYPYAVESQVLYYNKDTYSPEEIKTWKSLTEKGKIGTNFGEDGANYVFGPLFMSNGDYLYGENGEDPKGTNFNNQQGIEVLQWIADQKNNPGVIQSNTEALSNLGSGKTDAFLSGPWSKNDVEKALGDKMGAAAYPTIDFGNGEKQIKAFLGVRSFAVNQQTQAPLAAMTLANYLTSEKAQMTYFKEIGFVPSNKKLQTNEEITQDTVAKAILEMAQPTHSVVMPKIPEIVSFWPAMDAVINDTYKGNIKPADYQAKLDKLVQDTSKEAKE